MAHGAIRATIVDQGCRLKRELLDVIGDALARDRSCNDPATAERLRIALEGADALVPVLGAAAVTGHARAMVPSLMAGAAEADA